MPANEWLAIAEDRVARAALSRSVSGDLEVAAKQISIGRSKVPLDAGTLERLRSLRVELVKLQAQARLNYALHSGLDQLDQTLIVGYSRTGLEQAL
jgi:hypothetical protein